MYCMSCDFEEGKDCTRSLSKQPCYLDHKVKFFVICFLLLLITVSNFFLLVELSPTMSQFSSSTMVKELTIDETVNIEMPESADTVT